MQADTCGNTKNKKGPIFDNAFEEYVCPKCYVAIDNQQERCKHCGQEILWEGDGK